MKLTTILAMAFAIVGLGSAQAKGPHQTIISPARHVDNEADIISGAVPSRHEIHSLAKTPEITIANGQCTVRGAMWSMNSNGPIPRLPIELRPVDRSNHAVYSAETDANGIYSITVPSSVIYKEHVNERGKLITKRVKGPFFGSVVRCVSPRVDVETQFNTTP